jgi:hypothetical protein
MAGRILAFGLFVVAAALPLCAYAQSHPIDPKAPDGWQMLESLPAYPKAPCTARMAGREVNVNLSLNNAGLPVLVLARPDWRDLRGDAVAQVSVDGDRAAEQPVSMVNNLVVTLVDDPALLKKLKTGRDLAWVLPVGRFRGSIDGFDGALQAVTACVAKRDGVAAPGRP